LSLVVLHTLVMALRHHVYPTPSFIPSPARSMDAKW
jgi:hypothetical protein